MFGELDCIRQQVDEDLAQVPAVAMQSVRDVAPDAALQDKPLGMRAGQQQDLTLNIAQVAQEAEGMVGSQGAAPPDQVPTPQVEPPDSPQ